MTIETYKQQLERLIERVNEASDMIAAACMIDEIRVIMGQINYLERKASC